MNYNDVARADAELKGRRIVSERQLRRASRKTLDPADIWLRSRDLVECLQAVIERQTTQKRKDRA